MGVGHHLARGNGRSPSIRREGLLGNEAYGETGIKSFGNSPEHTQGVTLVVGVFQSGDHRLTCADFPGQLRLGKTTAGAETVELASHLRVDALFLDVGAQFGIIAEQASEYLERGCGCLGLGHGRVGP